MYRTFTRLLSRLIRANMRSVAAPFSVQYVDDPALPIRLVRVVGAIDPMSIHQVCRAWEHVRAPHFVHLDVQDACIADRYTMSRLEAALDRLEHDQIDVRIVGIDPHHPAIAS